MTELTGRTFLVTGANTGIGRATATDLARRGGRVHVAGRSAAKTQPVVDELRETYGAGCAEFLQLDLADIKGVEPFDHDATKPPSISERRSAY